MTKSEKYGKMLAIVDFFHSRDFGNEDFMNSTVNYRKKFVGDAANSILKMHNNLIERYAKSSKSPNDFLKEFGEVVTVLDDNELTRDKVVLDAMYIKVLYNTLTELSKKYDVELFSKEYYKNK